MLKLFTNYNNDRALISATTPLFSVKLVVFNSTIFKMSSLYNMCAV